MTGAANAARREDREETPPHLQGGLMDPVTGEPEWKPVLASLRAAGIPPYALTIRRQHVDEGEEAPPAPRIEFEICHRRIERMDAARRERIETGLRAAAPPFLPSSSLRIVWRRPVCAEWSSAYLAAGDALWRDWHRGRVRDVAFRRARQAMSALHREVFDGADHAPLLPRLPEILAEARRHPAPPRLVRPLRADEVGVGEAMAVLRRVVDGRAAPEIGSTPRGWKHLWHGTAEIRVDGWTFVAYRRHLGMRYVEEVRSPDGRLGTRESFAEREGDPFMLLEDAEQDAICAVLENGYGFVHGPGPAETGERDIAAVAAPVADVGPAPRRAEMIGYLAEAAGERPPLDLDAARDVVGELTSLEEVVDRIRILLDPSAPASHGARTERMRPVAGIERESPAPGRDARPIESDVANVRARDLA